MNNKRMSYKNIRYLHLFSINTYIFNNNNHLFYFNNKKVIYTAKIIKIFLLWRNKAIFIANFDKFGHL